ncbi:MAG: dockerin type I domain-containing protein [Patescibacteria group bacterium]
MIITSSLKRFLLVFLLLGIFCFYPSKASADYTPAINVDCLEVQETSYINCTDSALAQNDEDTLDITTLGNGGGMLKFHGWNFSVPEDHLVTGFNIKVRAQATCFLPYCGLVRPLFSFEGGFYPDDTYRDGSQQFVINGAYQTYEFFIDVPFENINSPHLNYFISPDMASNGTIYLNTVFDTQNTTLLIDSIEVEPEYTQGREPLILIPGIMGSEFEVKETFDPEIDNCLPDGNDFAYNQDDLVWLFTDLINVGYKYKGCDGKFLDVLQLQSDGETPLYTQVGLKGSLTDIPYNNDTIPLLLQQGYTLDQDLFILPYDWRQDIGISLHTLSNKIDAVLATASASQVNIMAHSMGGLVAREYIRRDDVAHKVDTLVTFGTPHVGSPKSLAMLMYPVCIKWKDFICAVNGNEVNKLVKHFTSAYELLPSQTYYDLYPNLYPFNDIRDIDNNNVTGKLNYDQTKTMLANLGKDTHLLNVAELVHGVLDASYTDTNGVDTYMIAGSGFDTIGQVMEYESGNTGLIKLDAIAINGDDTVPIRSATLNQSENVFYVKQKHLDLVKGTALQMGLKLLKNDTSLIPGVQTTPFKYKGKIISVHSPVALHAYDSEGNHTGPTEDGTIETNIPDSSYDELGEAKFISLPEEGEYEIRTNATGVGSFDLKVKTYEESELTRELLYLGIDQTTDTTSEMNLSQDEPILSVDTDNDGTTDRQLPPSYRLTGEALHTFTPPFTQSGQITASPAADTVTVGKPFKVDVILDGGQTAFNAARAAVSVSDNLSITSVQQPKDQACRLNYTKTPTKQDPSFAGALTGESSTHCTVYSLILTPTATGAGTVNISNASLKSYADASEMLEVTQNGIVDITASTISPTLSPLSFTITNADKTYKESFTLLGTKVSSLAHMFVNGSDTESMYPTTTSWQVPVTLNLGANNFILYGSDTAGNQTATKNITIKRHTLGDINGDGEVNLIDASFMAVDWDKTADLTYLLSDMNDDGQVDLTDLSILAKLEE